MSKTYIVVRFIENRPLLSKLIAWYTNSLWSHVEFGTPQGTWIGAHLKGGVQERPYSYCRPKREARYAIEVSPEAQAAFLRNIRAEIGTKYNVAGDLGIAIHDRSLTNKRERFCSQFVCRHLLKLFGPSKTWNLLPEWAHLMTPDMCHLGAIFAGRLLFRKG